jgi:hypothetical protein
LNQQAVRGPFTKEALKTDMEAYGDYLRSGAKSAQSTSIIHASSGSRGSSGSSASEPAGLHAEPSAGPYYGMDLRFHVIPYSLFARGKLLMKRSIILGIAVLAVAGAVAAAVYWTSNPAPTVDGLPIPAGRVIRITSQTNTSYYFTVQPAGRLVGAWAADHGVSPLLAPANWTCACQRFNSSGSTTGSFNATLAAGTYVLRFDAAFYPTNVTVTKRIEIVYP